VVSRAAPASPMVPPAAARNSRRFISPSSKVGRIIC
jgi:hypothetical protein